MVQLMIMMTLKMLKICGDDVAAGEAAVEIRNSADADVNASRIYHKLSLSQH